MARYKVLKSVAHGLGHSFASLMNYRGDDYVMGHLLRQMRLTGSDTLEVDLMSGEARPASLLIPEVDGAIRAYCAFLPQLVESHRSSMQFVQRASMSVQFDLSRRRTVRYSPFCEESPFVCRVAIGDDRGKVWSAEIRGWWYPEAREPKVSELRTHRGAARSRLGRIIRLLWPYRLFERTAT